MDDEGGRIQQARRPQVCVNGFLISVEDFQRQIPFALLRTTATFILEEKYFKMLKALESIYSQLIFITILRNGTYNSIFKLIEPNYKQANSK